MNQQYIEPQAVELEEAILGSFMLEPESLEIVVSDLKPHCFYKPENKHIFKAILDLRAEKSKVDIMLVCQQLHKNKQLESVGGSYYVASLTNRIASSANIEHHTRIVIQKYLERKVIALSQRTMTKLYSPGFDVFEVIDELVYDLQNSISEVSNSKGFDTIKTLRQPFMENLNAIKNRIIEPSIPVGLIEVDKYGGWFKSDLNYIGARPGMGKTAFVVKTLRNCCIDLNKPAGIFSLEMKANQLLTRIASAECKINSEDLRKGNVSDYEVNQLHHRLIELENAPLYIDDTSRDINVIITKARKMKREEGIELLVIDYLGFITAKGFRDKNAELTHISRELKALAKELDIPLIVLVQLSRASSKEALRFPILTDLRDSGSIEQDADMVMFLFRPDYYYVDNYTHEGVTYETKGKCFIIIAKNRHGVVESKLVGFNGQYTEFYDLPESKYQLPELPALQNNNHFLERNDIDEKF